MTINNVAMIALVASVASLLGCADRTQKESEVIDRVTAETPVLASTTGSREVLEEPPSEPTPANVSKPEELPEPKSTVFEPELGSIDGLTLRRVLTASHIEEREPVDAGSTFGLEHERIYVFIDATNESDMDESLMVHFVGPQGTVSGGIELVIPASSPRWRTWAYTRHAKKPGLWRVEIRDVNGSLIGALPFEVEAGL